MGAWHAVCWSKSFVSALKQMCYFVIFCVFYDDFMMEIDRQSCFSVNKIIFTSEQRVAHLFAGQNTQHSLQERKQITSKNKWPFIWSANCQSCIWVKETMCFFIAMLWNWIRRSKIKQDLRETDFMTRSLFQ